MDLDTTIEEGYVILARVLKYSKLWQCSPKTLKVGIYLLLSAKFEDEPAKGLTRGQCLKSYSLISEDCEITFKASRLAMDKLKYIEFVECHQHAAGTKFGQVISIVNYDQYQDADNYRGVHNVAYTPKPTKVRKQPVKVVEELFELKSDDKPKKPKEIPPSKRIAYNKDKKRFEGITKADEELWKIAYPSVIVAIEINQAVVWLTANPTKAPKSNYYKFLSSWFKRSQDRGGTRTGAGIPQKPTTATQGQTAQFPNYAQDEVNNALKRLENEKDGIDYGCK